MPSNDHLLRPTRTTLAVILASYLMIVLDLSIVISALPRIQDSLGFSAGSLSWVQNAYTLAFGGLLLLGARAGDILGRRRMFIVGIAVFTAASFAAGIAQTADWLIIARVVQGVGAAIAAPSTLALLMSSFREGPERTRAISSYAAVAGGGGSVGLVVGGILTSWVSWRAGLFINVPLGLALIWAAPRYLPETPRNPGRFDLGGALTSTLGMTSLVYGFVRAGDAGWTDSITLGAFVVGAALLALFVVNERRATQPITPLRLFKSRERAGALAARVLFVGAIYSAFFFVTQYLQGVKGFGPLEAGLAFLPMTLVVFSMTFAVPRLVQQFGTTRLLTAGLVTAVVAMAWLSRIGPETAYLTGIALPLLLLGIGAGTSFTTLTTVGVAGVAPEDSGAASGLVNVAHQLGGSLGVGILVTVFSAATPALPARSLASATARTDGLAHAISTTLAGGTVMLALALAIVLTVVRTKAAQPEPVIELEEALAEERLAA